MDDEKVQFLMELCKQLQLQVMVVSPAKAEEIAIVEPYIQRVPVVQRKDNRHSVVYDMPIRQLREQLIPQWIQADSGNFEKRYGLKSDPVLIRFRRLDPRTTNWPLPYDDLTIPAEQFALDAQGFQMLARLRSIFPQTRPFLMDMLLLEQERIHHHTIMGALRGGGVSIFLRKKITSLG